MPRPVNPNTQKMSGRDRTKDVVSFSLEPLTSIPQPQEWYTEAQTEFFVEVCTALVEARQLRLVDVKNVEIAAWWYSVANDAMKTMNEKGYIQVAESGWGQVRGELTALEKASRQLQAFADRYGINLASITKVRVAKSDKNKLSEMFA